MYGALPSLTLCLYGVILEQNISVRFKSVVLLCYLSTGIEYYPVYRLTHSDDDVDNNDNDNPLIGGFVKESRNDAFNYIYCRISR